MICPKCSQSNLDHALYCQDCGQKFERPGPSASDAPPEKKEAKSVPGENRPMTIQEELFSFQGRIGRWTYIKWAIPFILINFLVMSIDIATHGDFGPLSYIVGLVLIWPALALFVKRWHDRDRSLWFVLLIFIPLVNLFASVWVIIELYFLRGTVGDNRFGPDPLAAQAPEESFKRYGGSGICDVCNRSVGPNEAYLIPVNTFYGSQKYKQWLSSGPLKTMVDMAGGNVEAHIARMKAMDNTSHSAVCRQCVHLFN